MRINVYEEEITDEVEVIEVIAKNNGKKFYGVRCFLKSASELHHTSEDDDRSAVTFYVGYEHDAHLLKGALEDTFGVVASRHAG